MFVTQLGNELQKMFARRRTYIGFIAFAALQLTILLLLQLPEPRRRFEARIERFGGLFADYFGGLTLGLLAIVISFALLGALYIALVSGDIVAKEVEDGTMRMVLARPVSRLRLLALKWLACAIYTAVLVLFLGAVALGAATVWRGGAGKLFVRVPPEGLTAMYDTAEGLWRYWRAVACLMYSALAISSIAFMFSCLRMKPAAATILTLSVLFIDMVVGRIDDLEPYRHWFITHHMRSWSRSFFVEPPWGSILASWAYLGALHIVCCAIGAAVFCRRDLKG